MNREEKKQIAKHILSDSLSKEEAEKLLQSEELEARLFRQWENPADRSKEVNSERLWNGIRQQIGSAEYRTRNLFYKWYSVAASILLLIAFGGMAALWKQQPAAPIYVVASGIQNLEKVKLPDGTEVCLGPGSRLEYPSEFSAASREVRLEGQAFFEVAKDPEKPFRVQMDEIKVEALGTAFELFNYEDSEEVEAILVNGKIKVDWDSRKGKSSQIMNPNECLKLNKKTYRKELGIIDADKYTSWRSGILSFENENLAMIIPRLEHWYGRRIECEESLLNNYRFTFKVRDESLDVLLFILRQSALLQYKKDANENYIITKRK